MREFSRLVFLLRSDLARLPGQTGPRPDELPSAWRIPGALLASRGYLAAATHRISRFLRLPRRGRLASLLARSAVGLFRPVKIFVLLYAKISIPDALEIGPGLLLSDRGRIILAGRKFGANLTIGPNVTAGQLKESDATPLIGDDVVLEGDCVLFGRITVGDGCVVTAGSALCRNAPAGVTVRGNPPVFLRPEQPGRPLPSTPANLPNAMERLARQGHPPCPRLRNDLPRPGAARPPLARAEAMF